MAKDVWDMLKAQYKRNTLENKLFLKKHFFTTKMAEGQSVQAHLKAIKEITDKLGAVGAAVADGSTHKSSAQLRNPRHNL